MQLQGIVSYCQKIPAFRWAKDTIYADLPPEDAIGLTVPRLINAIVVAGLVNSQKPMDETAVAHQNPTFSSSPLVVVTARSEDARKLADELPMYLDMRSSRSDVILFPGLEISPFERVENDRSVIHQRLKALDLIVSTHPRIVVTSIEALAQKTVDKTTFQKGCQVLQVGQEIQIEELLRFWVTIGYSIESLVEIPGEVSHRGGIVDVFPPNSDSPVRIEFWGDVIESIRSFDPTTQLSYSDLNSLEIIPASEILPGLAAINSLDESILQNSDSDKFPVVSLDRIRDEVTRLSEGTLIDNTTFYAGLFNKETIFDYLSLDTILVLVEPQRIARKGLELDKRVADSRELKQIKGEIPIDFPSMLWSWDFMEKKFERFTRRLCLGGYSGSQDASEIRVRPPDAFQGKLDQFADWVNFQKRQGDNVVIVSENSEQISAVLKENGIGSEIREGLILEPESGDVTLLQASLEEGFILSFSSNSLIVVTDKEIFGRIRRNRSYKSETPQRAIFLSELHPGSLVVHVDHGIARFVGTHRTRTQTDEKEYLHLEFAEGDRLFVPTDSLDRIAPYFSSGDLTPKLTRLGTQEWNRTKDRAKKSALEMAQELVDLHAARETLPGHAFSPDTPWQRELEDSFPYIETPDQLRTIREVTEGMENAHPMDRLICGDVGYGKTEIAIRAAFKAVQDNKQVAILCPTTVLARQHFVTFNERLKAFPVKIEVVSRFQTDLELSNTLKGLKEGNVDIVIGTHRLIQRDIQFKDLGLVVIDDEQKFGVGHKEKFKRFRKEIDVLTLSATPIPRTLYMALSSIRDMSTINTPPNSRQSVQTFVSEYSDEVVRDAIYRELDRDGQVFFLYNRVSGIEKWVGRIRELVPQARVGVAHGRMHENDLASVIDDFSSGKIDVLVCTTIIEAGLDLPNANTIIVYRPELLGLAQMYQLRGRVGRSPVKAFAHFLLSEGKALNDLADQRLKAIIAYQELGSGFRIAMRDLEIRGTGNLLGREQSGHIFSIGFDLYCRLLEESVDAIKQSSDSGIINPTVLQPSVNLPLGAYIPESYINDLPQRLTVYQRLTRLVSYEEIPAIERELRDRFGLIPQPLENLLFVIRIKMLARDSHVESVYKDKDQIVLRFGQSVGGARNVLQKQLSNRAIVGDRLVKMRMKDDWSVTLPCVLERLIKFQEELKSLAAKAY